MANIAIFRINYKSDFILTLNSDAGWMTPFCIKFWTGAPSQAYFVGYDGTTYTHCAPVDGEPTKLRVQFDDHHLPIGDLKFQIGYHFTVADFPTSVEDEVLNQASVIIEVDDEPAQVMLDFNGETSPEIEFSLPAYANEAQRIANEEQRIAAEQQRIANEDARIQAEETRQQNEQQRIDQETARVNEFARLKRESEQATTDANAAAILANEKAQLAADKAALAQAAATLANEKAQLAADKAALANDAAQLAADKAALAQQKAEYAQQQGGYAKDQGDYAKNQGNYAKEQGEIAQADHERAEADHGIAVDDHTQAGNDHTRAESDHGIAVNDHTQAGNDHTRAESDHGIAVDDHTQAGNDHTRAEADHGIAADDHTQAGNDHTRAESDHTRAESDHAAVEPFVDSLGAFDISAYHATGGVLAKYADLTAALGTNGANIPEALRKGGMSVKFVQSSDNKYLQYRYMPSDASTSATFTNVANWQGMDDVPTAGSQNLVTSGGVETQLQRFSNNDVVLRIGLLYVGDGKSYLYNNTRAYTEKIIKYPFSVKCNEGYLIRGIYKYILNEDGSFTFDSYNSLGGAQYTSNGSYACVLLFCKSDDTEEISDLNAIIQSISVDKIPNGSISLNKINTSSIDSTPTENSNNLVTSGGVKAAIDKLDVRTRPLDFDVEIGSYIGAGIKKDSTTRMRANVVFANPKAYVDVETKTGYLANLGFYNESGTNPVLSGWSNNIHIKNDSYPYFYIVFKRSDEGAVTSEDLDCVENAIIEGLDTGIANLDTRVTNLEQATQSTYADRPSSGYETFDIQCNTVVADTDSTNLSAQDSKVNGNDKCRLYLPESYQKSGKPTRLIIHCHGASVNYNYNNFSPLGINQGILDYMLASGYAVLFVSGMAGNNTLQIGTTSGSPLAYQCHIKAYNYVTKKYNLKKDGVFVYGISAGSIPALQIANFTDIPVLANIIYCGIYSVPRAFMLLGGYSAYYAQMKQYIADQYDFSTHIGDWSGDDPVSDSEWKYLIDNVHKFAGWNSFLRGATTRMSQEDFADFVSDYFGSSLPIWIDNQNITFDTIDQLLMTIKVKQKNTQSPTGDLLLAVNAEKTLYDSVSLYRNVPLKIFHAVDDATAPYRYAKYYYEMLKRGGSQVEFRTFSSGGHAPYGNDVAVVIDGKTVNTCVFAIESLLFCERFE